MGIAIFPSLEVVVVRLFGIGGAVGGSWHGSIPEYRVGSIYSVISLGKFCWHWEFCLRDGYTDCVGISCQGCGSAWLWRFTILQLPILSLLLVLYNVCLGTEDVLGPGVCGSRPFYIFTFFVLFLFVGSGVWEGARYNISTFPVLHLLVGPVASLIYIENLCNIKGLPSFGVCGSSTFRCTLVPGSSRYQSRVISGRGATWPLCV